MVNFIFKGRKYTCTKNSLVDLLKNISKKGE